MKRFLLGFAILLSITLIVSGGEAQQNTDYWRIGETPGIRGSDVGWRVDGNGNLVPVTGDQVNVGASTQEVNYGFFTNITLGGTNKSSWGSIVSPMSDAVGYVYPTDSGGNLQLRDDGDLRLGGGVATDVEIRFDGNVDDFIIALDNSVDDLVIAYGSTVGTDNRITIIDDAATTTVVIGDSTEYSQYLRFAGIQQDYYFGVDNNLDYLVMGGGTTMNAVTHCVAVPSGTSPKLFLWHGLDGYGAVDIDYGSNNITDHQFTTDGGIMMLDGQAVTFDVGTNKDAIRNYTDDTISIVSEDSDITLEVYATIDTKDAIFQLKSDSGADNGDTWQVKNDDADSNALLFINDTTGTALPKVEISVAGAIMASGDVTIINHDANNNSIVDVATFQHDVTGTAADTGGGSGVGKGDGIGAGLTFDLENSAGTIEEHGSIDFVCVDVTDATEDTSVVFKQFTGGTVQETLRLSAGLGDVTADVLQFTSHTSEINGVVDIMRLKLLTPTTSATPAAAFGAGISIWMEDTARDTGTSDIEEQASIDFVYSTVTSGSEDVDIKFSQNLAGTIEERVMFDADGPNIHLKGTTPYMTIGDAGAEDTKIVFDGNAADYHIGLDDDAPDKLIIGLGSALGTTPAIRVNNENVEVMKTLSFGTHDVNAAIRFDPLDRQLLASTRATYCVATTDPIFEFLAASPDAGKITANQEVFGVARGSQAANRRLFAVDAEGDIFITGDVVSAATAVVLRTTSLTHRFKYIPVSYYRSATIFVANGYPIECVGLSGSKETGAAEGFVRLDADADILRFRFAIPETYVSSQVRAASDLVIEIDCDATDPADINASAVVNIYERGNTSAIVSDNMSVSQASSRGWVPLRAGGIGTDVDINQSDVLLIDINDTGTSAINIYGIRLFYRTGVQPKYSDAPGI